MIRWIGLTALIGLAGCTYYYPPPGMPSPYAGGPAGMQPQGHCREFTQRVTIDGQPTDAVGTMCQQPDGTWRLM